MLFTDRIQAAQKLSKSLDEYKNSDVVVLALPRGGVVLGAIVAKALKAPLGVVLVRKLSHPLSSEFAIGAVAEGQEPVLSNPQTAELEQTWLTTAVKDARQLIKQRHALYGKVMPNIKGKTIIIVDDGIATGLTMETAARYVKQQKPQQIIVAVPVAPQDALDRLVGLADRTIVLDNPDNFLGAVGSHYDKFEQVDDTEVQQLLKGGATNDNLSDK